VSLAPQHPRRFAFIIFIFLLSFSGLLIAEDNTPANENPCQLVLVGSVPSRPTVSGATDTTQCGVVEMEYGMERQWEGEGIHHDDLTGGLRFGITPNLDFHWDSSDYMAVVGNEDSHYGFGDTWLGLKYRLSRQTRHVPSFGVFYTAKVPSASAVLGGTGRVDHSLAVLMSKDVHRLHFDFNVAPQLNGRPGASGFDHNTRFSLASYLPLSKRLTLVTEEYGFTLLNSATPAFASTMAGFTYQVSPRFVLDSGVDVGVTSYAPRKRVFVGVTYAVANVYNWVRPPR
jgi:Putative MetA-pathway of phenol degradation